MKKSVLFLFLIFSNQIILAQSYFFNTLVKYTSGNRESILYTNSKNDAYYLRVLKLNDVLIADILDVETSKVHSFNIVETKSKEEIIFDFSYIKTDEFNNGFEKTYSDYVIDFQEIERNDSIRKVKLIVYKNKKKKKIIIEYFLEIKDHSENLFPSFRQSCMHPMETFQKLNIFENGVVINASGNSFFNNKNITTKLEEIKEVNLELKIPKKQN